MSKPKATGGGRRNHLSPPNPNVVLFISLFLILMTPSFISFTSQVFTPLLVQELKTKHGLRLILLLVIVTVCVFLPINNSENTSINDEHACNNSGGYLLYRHYQQRESKSQPKTKSKSKGVDDQDVMRSGTSKPSPHAGGRRSQERAAQKPLSPPNGSSCSGDDERMSSRSDSSSFIPLPPPLPPFEIQPPVYTTYVRVHSDNSSRCDLADSMTGSTDVNVKAEHFIGNYRKKVKADFEKQGRGKSNPARLRSSKTRRKNEK